MQVNHILGSRPVAQIGEVMYELCVLEEFEHGQVVEVEGGGEEGDEFEFECEAVCWWGCGGDGGVGCCDGGKGMGLW